MSLLFLALFCADLASVCVSVTFSLGVPVGSQDSSGPPEQKKSRRTRACGIRQEAGRAVPPELAAEDSEYARASASR